MVILEISLPDELPHAFAVHPATWRLPKTRLAVARPGISARHLLHRLLLGPDAAAVRGRYHEHHLDCRSCHPGASGKSHERRAKRLAPGWAGTDHRGHIVDLGSFQPVRLSAPERQGA